MSSIIRNMTSPISDFGTVEFATELAELHPLLLESIYEKKQGNDVDNEALRNRPLSLQYENQQQLLRLIVKLQQRLHDDEAKQIRCRFSIVDSRNEMGMGEISRNSDSVDIADVVDSNQTWLPLHELFAEVEGRSVSEYILHNLFTTHLQPIVQPEGMIMGYEFLLRPLPELKPFRPAQLFQSARQIRQHSFLDRAARQLAIRLGSIHLEKGTKRFINFLPSSFHHADLSVEETLDLIRNSGTDPQDYVFEVIETERLDDPALHKVFEAYRKQGAQMALDDVGSGFATLNIVDQLQPDYVKMDRQWVSNCDIDSDKQKYIDDLLERVTRIHGTVLAEGIEREEEWQYLKKAGIPLFQGYLFGRAAPLPVANTGFAGSAASN
ncbi:MAG: EAL domain-containing protein [Candidatus Cohnella colombiensis]|uniref:EAL domain-containing protein n=1 Tax=Candidatus Cohnella colombiensis TaxID=3121368 RepID=A0AA95F1G6_9BACL|nr:MAG: EAL domain-containing protein [Cohnella sp.]